MSRDSRYIASQPAAPAHVQPRPWMLNSLCKRVTACRVRGGLRSSVCPPGRLERQAANQKSASGSSTDTNGVAFTVATGWIVGNPSRGRGNSRCRLNSELVVHGGNDSLCAAEVASRSLDRDIAEEKLNLLQFATRGSTKASAVCRRSCGCEPFVADSRGGCSLRRRSTIAQWSSRFCM